MHRHDNDRIRPFADQTPLVHPADASETYAPTMPTLTSLATRVAVGSARPAGERMQVLP